MSWLALAIAALALTGGQALAAASNCASLPGGTPQERDRRHMCRALAENDRLKCASISDRNLRHLCDAQASGDPMRCASILDRNARNYCKGVAGPGR